MTSLTLNEIAAHFACTASAANIKSADRFKEIVAGLPLNELARVLELWSRPINMNSKLGEYYRAILKDAIAKA